MITASQIRVQSWENVCLHVISDPNLCNIGKLIPFVFGGTNKIRRIKYEIKSGSIFEEQTAARLNSADKILFPITLCDLKKF